MKLPLVYTRIKSPQEAIGPLHCASAITIAIIIASFSEQQLQLLYSPASINVPKSFGEHFSLFVISHKKCGGRASPPHTHTQHTTPLPARSLTFRENISAIFRK